MSKPKTPPQAFTGSNLRITPGTEAMLAAKTLEAAQLEKGYKYKTFYNDYGKPYLKLVKA